MDWWTFGWTLKEGETIQSSLKHVYAPKTIAKLSKNFVEQMQKVNVDSAIKLIANNMQNGILPLTDTTLKLLKQKHSKSAHSWGWLGSYFVCKRFAVQALQWSLEFVIQIIPLCIL